MLNTGKLAGRTAFITGASRGIGKEIGLKIAKDGGNVVIAAKTVEAHPKLPGTIYTAAKEMEEAGGKALPCVVDVRSEESVQQAVDEAVKKFGGIDILVNNASAINLTGTLELPMKRFDLMHQINTRGTYLVSKLCLPYLKVGKNPHILNLSPPLNLNSRWFKNHVGYTMAKYGMSMCVLGMSEEFKSEGVAVNALWPKTAIWTAAMGMLGGDGVAEQCRKPEIMADAAYVMLTRESRNYTGNFAIDEQILKESGVSDLDQYAVQPGKSLLPDFFLDELDSKAVEEYLKEGKLDAPQQESQLPKGQVGEIINKIRGFIEPSLVEKTQSVYQFDVKGSEKCTWFLDLKNGEGGIGEGAPPKADVTFTMDTKDFTKMFSGSLKPTTAFMMGKLKIKGDMGKAMKLEKLLGRLKSKL